jgi:hypothetical protein
MIANLFAEKIRDLSRELSDLDYEEVQCILK